MEHKPTFLGRRVNSWTVECVCGWRISRDTRYKLGRALGKHKRGEL